MVSPPVLELLSWISSKPRTYADAMEAWRTTCPRHSAWEDALLDGFIEVIESRERSMVVLTARGRTIFETLSCPSNETFPL